MDEIKQVVVIGSGVMGAGIAAHIANSNTLVTLLDIVPDNAVNRNILTSQALDRIRAQNIFTHPTKEKYLTIGNVEDDFNVVAEADWVIEVVIEKLEIKQNLYHKIDQIRKKGSIISSNTSTIPLNKLAQGLSEQFKKDFLITHFFNPPRYMRLLELITSSDNSDSLINKISKFIDSKLGKGVVKCKDTPGFIANRIGCYWLEVAIREAIKYNVKVEEADLIFSKSFGIPKTAIFGLLDLIGIDLMPLIAKGLLADIPENDDFRKIYTHLPLAEKMINEGYTGRKGKGGFYRVIKDNGVTKKEILDLNTGLYRAPETADLPFLKGKNLREILETDHNVARFAKEILIKTLKYSASLIPEIADDLRSIDEVMRLGYNWQYGPFELIDKLSIEGESGALWISKQNSITLLEKLGNQLFYKQETGKKYYFDALNYNYKQEEFDIDAWRVADINTNKTSLIKANGGVNLYDAGDNVLLAELTSKMNIITHDTAEMLETIAEMAKSGKYAGLIIGGDSEYFSAGANLSYLLDLAKKGNFSEIEAFISRVQQAFYNLKHMPIAVVSALTGIAFGGGAEIALNSTYIQAFIETITGLVEVRVGLVPAWGGCKEMLIRHNGDVKKVFDLISKSVTTKSAEDIKEVYNRDIGITMNRKRLLADAKAVLLNHKAVAREDNQTHKLYNTDFEIISNNHQRFIEEQLKIILTNNNKNYFTEKEILELEKMVILELLKNKMTWERIEYMLNNNKPLNN